jgi:enamine deaminase RidA (YjgF/YER057c/UK114 family)
MENTAHNIGIASHIGQVQRRRRDTAAKDAISLQHAWANVMALLEKAGMGPEHLVKVSQYLTRSEDIPKYRPIRSKWLGENKPAFLLAVTPGLVRDDF